MADTGIVEIDGKRMKKCPGWEGNSYRCGRGNPRLIPEAGEVCENCSRGMRKRGQKTREEEERAAAAKKRENDRLERGLHAVEEALIPEGGAGITAGNLRRLVQTIEALDEQALEPGSYWRRDKIGVGDRWAILRKLAGLEPEEKGSRYYR